MIKSLVSNFSVFVCIHISSCVSSSGCVHGGHQILAMPSMVLMAQTALSSST